MSLVLQSGKTFVLATQEPEPYLDGVYVWGRRWIASKNRWSSNVIGFYLKEHSVVPENFGPDQTDAILRAAETLGYPK